MRIRQDEYTIEFDGDRPARLLVELAVECPGCHHVQLWPALFGIEYSSGFDSALDTYIDNLSSQVDCAKCGTVSVLVPQIERSNFEAEVRNRIDDKWFTNQKRRYGVLSQA